MISKSDPTGITFFTDGPLIIIVLHTAAPAVHPVRLPHQLVNMDQVRTAHHVRGEFFGSVSAAGEQKG